MNLLEWLESQDLETLIIRHYTDSHYGQEKKMSSAKVQPKQKTIQKTYRIDVKFTSTIGEYEKSCYIVVTGIPEELPKEYYETIKLSAEQQFANALQTKSFLELYPVGKTAKDCHPLFFNVKNINYLEISNVTDID